MYEYDHWDREIRSFDRSWAKADLEDETRTLLMRGLVFVSTQACEKNPNHSGIIAKACMDRLCNIREEMGDHWFFARLEIVASHGPSLISSCCCSTEG